MPLFMSQFSFTPEAVANLVSKPHNRSPALAKHLEKVGGKLIGVLLQLRRFRRAGNL